MKVDDSKIKGEISWARQKIILIIKFNSINLKVFGLSEAIRACFRIWNLVAEQEILRQAFHTWIFSELLESQYFFPD